jgi:hypothetical protein
VAVVGLHGAVVNHRPTPHRLGDEAGVAIAGLGHRGHGSRVDGGVSGRDSARSGTESATDLLSVAIPLAEASHSRGVRNPASCELPMERGGWPHVGQRSHIAW